MSGDQCNDNGHDGEDSQTDKTQVMDHSTPRPPSVEIINGSQKGKKFSLSMGTTLFGRALECDVVLADAQVSRQHFQIKREPAGCKLEDKGSGNGTKLNRIKVDTVSLKHGDLIEIGSLKIKYLEPLPVKFGKASASTSTSTREKNTDVSKTVIMDTSKLYPAIEKKKNDTSIVPVRIFEVAGQTEKEGEEKSPAPTIRSPKSEKRLKTITLIVGIFCLLTMLLAISGPSKEEIYTAHKTRLLQHGNDLFLQGVELYKNNNLDESLKRFEAATQIITHSPLLERYVKTIGLEIKNHNAYLEGLKHFQNGDNRKAKLFLSQVVAPSSYYQKCRDLIKKIENTDPFFRGVTAFDQGDYGTALEEFEQIPQDEIDNETTKYMDMAKIELSKGWDKKLNGKGKTLRKSNDARVKKALGYYAGGNLRKTLRVINKIYQTTKNYSSRRKINSLIEKLEIFDRQYNRGLMNVTKNNYNDAIDNLEQARKYDRQILPGQKSTFTGKIDRKLGEMYFLRGIAAFKNNKLSPAYLAWQKSLGYNPRLKKSKERLQKLEKEAQRLYLDGYILRNLDPKAAQKKWKTVIEIVPPSNEWYQKVKKQLAP